MEAANFSGETFIGFLLLNRLYAILTHIALQVCNPENSTRTSNTDRSYSQNLLSELVKLRALNMGEGKTVHGRSRSHETFFLRSLEMKTSLFLCSSEITLVT